VGFCGADPSEVAFGKPAPLSQGCEVRASSAPLDTRERKMFPAIVEKDYQRETPKMAESAQFAREYARWSIPM